MKKRYFILLIFLLFTCVSCMKFLLKKNGIINGKATLKKIKYEEKDILFLPIVHISQQSFYDECKKIIDSLSNKGYYIFGEGLITESLIKGKIMSAEDTIYDKKIRKIYGVDVSFHASNQIIKTLFAKYNLIQQPAELYTIKVYKDSLFGKNIDCTTKDLVEAYEKEKGKIILDSCDINTQIGEEYKCVGDSKNRKYFREAIVLGKRNKHIVEQVKNSKHQKLLLIYGRNHYDGIKKLLEGDKK